MKKFMAYVKILAILWMTLVVVAIILLLAPILEIILPESWKEKIYDKLDTFKDWLIDILNDLFEEL